MEVFYCFAGVESIVEMWRQSYNKERPHSSLGHQTPVKFAVDWQVVSGTKDESPQQNEMSISL